MDAGEPQRARPLGDAAQLEALGEGYGSEDHGYEHRRVFGDLIGEGYQARGVRTQRKPEQPRRDACRYEKHLPESYLRPHQRAY